jgi:methionyl aminopeptidase
MLLKIDAGVCVNGLHTDAARTFAIGKVSPQKIALMRVCEESFFKGVQTLRDGARLGTLGAAIQAHAQENGFSVIRELVGHGIGRTVHEDPNVPNFGTAGTRERVYENMTIAIEPMLAAGKHLVKVLNDGWTVVTVDGLPSAHYENTVVVLKDGYEILTV